MNWDAVGNWGAILPALLSMICLMLVAYLRQRQVRHAQMARMMVSLHGAIRREIAREELAEERWWERERAS